MSSITFCRKCYRLWGLDDTHDCPAVLIDGTYVTKGTTPNSRSTKDGE